MDIPDHLTDPNLSPQPFPCPAPTVQVGPSIPATLVHSRPKPFKHHKESLERIKEEFSLEDQASDESEAEAELETTITEVKKYFLANPDFSTLYRNPEADTSRNMVLHDLSIMT